MERQPAHQAQFRKSIWDQETNYLNYFLFPPSLPSFHFLSILAAFAFMCIFVDFTTKNYVKALGKKYQNTHTQKKLLSIFYNKKYNKTSSFISPFKHVVSRVPREHRQMNNEDTTKLAYYILLERTKRNSGWTFRASLFSCSLKTVQSNLDRYCPTVRYSSFTVRWHSLEIELFRKEGNYMMDFTCSLWTHSTNVSYSLFFSFKYHFSK